MSEISLHPLGDAALVVTFGTTLSEETNERMMALAAALDEPDARREVAGIRDVVPALASLVVHFDPAAADLERAASWLQHKANATQAGEGRAFRTHEVPVRYGGDDGPDLADVAAFASCSPEEVIERHAAATYRVYMLGFLPGFAYLGRVDARIAAPRRATPRQRVPTGSVGIAGVQTGIYPQDSPGGWQLIGRTDTRMFDVAEGRSLFQPGDRVRFVPEGRR